VARPDAADTLAPPGLPHPWLRHVACLWQVEGAVPLPAGQSDEEAFGRLSQLFDTMGTRHRRAGPQLLYAKKDPVAQDRMAVFETGALTIDRTGDAAVLRYHLASRALLFCLFLPLLFLGFAQLTIWTEKPKPPATEAQKKKDEAKKPPLQLHWIDKALGAPEPKKPDKDEEGGKRRKKPSPTAAYVFAGLFAALYLIGRFLEPWLVRRLFERRLQEPPAAPG
jgi:hypothetical protein